MACQESKATALKRNICHRRLSLLTCMNATALTYIRKATDTLGSPFFAEKQSDSLAYSWACSPSNLKVLASIPGTYGRYPIFVSHRFRWPSQQHYDVVGFSRSCTYNALPLKWPAGIRTAAPWVANRARYLSTTEELFFILYCMENTEELLLSVFEGGLPLLPDPAE